MFLSTLVRSYALTILLASDGLIVSSIRKLGFISTFDGVLFTRSAVVLAMIYVLLPFFLFIAYSAQKVDFVHLREVAIAQGASQLQHFIFIFLPHALLGLMFGFLGTFVLATTFYITPELLGGGKGESMMLASLIAQQVYQFGDWQGAAALSLLLLAVVVCVTGLTYACWLAVSKWQEVV
jgi:ABC-type spermidine/putrescine transport system permease subunit I